MIDLAVAYRIYPGIPKSPAFFSTDKLRLSEMGLQSFKTSLGKLRVKIWAILDGCPPEYEGLFRQTSQDQELEILSLDNRCRRTASSTCLTFLTSREILLRTQLIFRTYSPGNWDYPLGLALTQKSEMVNLRIHWANLSRRMVWGPDLEIGFFEIVIWQTLSLMGVSTNPSYTHGIHPPIPINRLATLVC
jgi:hypothetical protein